MTDKSIPLATHHLALTNESLLAYNRAVQKLTRFWEGERTDFPLDELSQSWFDLVDAGERNVDEDLVKSVAKEVNKRRKQLEVSRNTERELWTEPTVRNLEHSTAEDTLDRAASQLKDARDTL